MNVAKKRSKKHQFGKSPSGFSISNFWNEQKHVFKFLLSFLLVVLVFFTISTTDTFQLIIDPVTNAYAWIGSKLLNILSYNTIVRGDTISTDQFSINIAAGCDAVAPMILYCACIVVLPIRWALKWPGLIYGTLFLFILNLVRIITLFIAHLHNRSLFDFLHLEIWQILFIAVTIFVWLYWYRWAQQEMQTLKNA